ncbi:TrbI/VirB10 family protein [Roseobacter sp. MH60115]|uniref:TrbI/VirB10 family protein n=1 Tax=Roseobacter sp. MH60115 TaxID=2785324 RepID=UPI001E5F08C9|nr:TrbI/VirB10 family protein [Roseobacter sp. MH60115]
MTGNPNPNTEDMGEDMPSDAPGRTPGVRRLNRLPLIIGCSIALLLLGLMTLALMNRTAIREGTDVASEESRQSAGDDASALTSGQPDGIISAEPVDLGPSYAETVETSDPATPSAARPATAPAASPTPEDDRPARLASRIAEYEDERLMQQMQLEDRLETDALNSNTRLALPGLDGAQNPRNGQGSTTNAQAVATAGVAFPGLPGPQATPTASPQGTGQPLTAGEALTAIQGSRTAETGEASNEAAKAAFLEGAGRLDTSDYLQRSVQKPLSPYELKQGSVIPGVMITGINSDLPGRIIGQVSRNVYDSTTGQYLLIPQGTKIFGRYDNDVAFGQQRVLVAWTRLVFPNGSSINIEGMAGTDQAGAGGFTDRVNNHWGRTLSSALLISVIGAGVENLTDSGDSDDVADAIRDSFGDTFSSVATRSVERSLSVQPTLEIRPGYRFLIVVDKDMVLKPYG